MWAGQTPNKSAGDIPLTNWLAFMTRNDGARALYLGRAYLALVIGTVLIGAVAVSLFPAEAAPGSDTEPEPSTALPFFGFVILWPAVSSLLLWGLLEALRRLLPTYWHAAGAAAFVFAGVFTALSDLLGGLIFAWPYFIYALTFLAWHLRSTLDGLAMTFGLQVAGNLTLSLLI